MAVTKIKPIKSTLSKALDYIQNPDKTDGKMLVSSFGCSYETADIEFEYTLSQALQKGNNLAFHLIQSFEPGEVDYETAHKIGKQLADAVTKGQHEYVLTTHIDKGHVHNHIIFCAVNFVDHHKYNSNKRSYYGIRNMSDRLCRENGLSVIVPKKGNKGKSYAEYQEEKTGTSRKGKLKIAVDALIPQVSSFEELLQRLQAAGYEIKPGKYVSCRAPGQERFTRLKTLGADYTEEAIHRSGAELHPSVGKGVHADEGGRVHVHMERDVPRGAAEGGGEVLGQHVLAGGLAARQQQVFAAEQGGQRLLPHLFAVVGKGRGRDAGPQRSVQRMGGTGFLYRRKQGRVHALLPQRLKKFRHCTIHLDALPVVCSKPAAQPYHSTIAGICVGGVRGKTAKRGSPDRDRPSSHEKEEKKKCWIYAGELRLIRRSPGLPSA